MQYDEFVGQVQARARLGSTGNAVAAIRATLQTLSERLFGGAASNLGAQLPREIAHYLQDVQTEERFGLDEFYSRVAKRENADYPDAVFHARVVMEVVAEAVTRGEMAKVRAQFPAEFDPLFEPVTQGSGSRTA